MNSKIYVDKSPVLELLNDSLDTEQRFVCISRPRRFGKSVTAKMICAYYAKDQESEDLFDHLKIALSPSYRQFMNHYDVIRIDMNDEYNRASNDIDVMISNLTMRIVDELKVKYPECRLTDDKDLSMCLGDVFVNCGDTFVVVIDEWDCIFRENSKDTKAVKKFCGWLNRLLKDKEYISLAYMTGILPIKKYGSHSVLNMFREFSMTGAGKFAPFIGFTEDEVKELCRQYQRNFQKIKRWYDGYSLPECDHIYNPNSVVNSIESGKYVTYWGATETYYALKVYINRNMDGLKDAIINLIGGEEIEVNPAHFQNDMITFESSNDILTLLIHLGYLAVRVVGETSGNGAKYFVRIPNREIRHEFMTSMENNAKYPRLWQTIMDSERLLQNMWEGNEAEVARGLDAAHSQCSALTYNDENSLACAISLALNNAQQDRYHVVREMPAGKGFADMVYLPLQGVQAPAMVVELKYNHSTQAAIAQIKEKNYPEALHGYIGEVLLVGVNYDPKTKDHSCQIERISLS